MDILDTLESREQNEPELTEESHLESDSEILPCHKPSSPASKVNRTIDIFSTLNREPQLPLSKGKFCLILIDCYKTYIKIFFAIQDDEL